MPQRRRALWMTNTGAERRTTEERNVDVGEDGPHHGGDEWTRVGHALLLAERGAEVVMLGSDAELRVDV